MFRWNIKRVRRRCTFSFPFPNSPDPLPHVSTLTNHTTSTHLQNTNLPQLFALLKKDDFNEQLCYYQPGIGTWFNPGVVSPLFAWGAKMLDYAFAWYLDTHVMDGYKFIMNNWRVGDKICLFGFSRGAYTARALAGALYKVSIFFGC